MVKNNYSKSAREIFNISRWAIKFSWLTVCFWIGVTAAGLLAFSSLKYALFPDITFPVVVVNAQAPITSAIETEEKLTKPIEASLKSIPGIDNIRSSTYPGQSAISLLFAVGTNLEASTQKTTSVLKGVKLPAGTSYKIIPLNLNESSVVSYAIESESKNLDDLHQLAKAKIIPTIEKLAGVLKVSLLGTAPKSALPNTSSLIPDNGNLIRFNGKDVLAFQVVKRGDANTLEVVDKVNQEVNKLRSSLKNVTFTLAATQADYIREATQSTINALIEAIILAVVVIFPFLWSWRATLISALAIPISLLATLIVMAYFGFNLETITLLALALIIGSVIDDAIIDVENILRHIQNGQSPKEAAHSATDEIGLTVVAATATAIAVFLPIGLMGGVVGQFFKPFGITVSAAYIASTLVARTLSPVLSIYWLKPPKKSYSLGRMRGKKQGLLSSLTNMGGYVNQSYANLLYWSLNHRKIVILLAIVSFVAGLAIIPFIPKGFIPKLDRGEFNISYTAPLPKIPDLSALQQLRTDQDPTQLLISPPNPLQDSLTVAKKLEAVVRKYPDVETVFTTVGSRGGEPNKGNLYVKLKKDRQLKTAQLQDQLRQTLPKLPGVTTSVEDIQFVDTGGDKPLQVALRGDDLATLSSVSKKIKERIINLPGFADVTVTGDGNATNQVLQVERLNQQRVVYISANLGGNLTLGDATDRIVMEAKSLLPTGVTLDLGGDSARQNEVVGSFLSTLILSALCIILVLVLLFKSWVDPLVIGASLPLAVVGAMLALLFTKSDFGMISLIGFVFLLGQANKNAILLVDYINQLRRAGMERTEAILEAGPVRLRPIMITTFSTILGMSPIALGFGAGSELRSPMAIAIAGGLVTSTILSLVVVPVVYAILDDWFPQEEYELTYHKDMTDILILSNGPGEVTTWVRPVVIALREQLGNDISQVRISVILSPCPHGTGEEARIAKSYPQVNRVQAPEYFWQFLFMGKTAENWDWRKKGVVIFLGGDQVFPVIVGRKLGYKTLVYAEWEARWHNLIDCFAVMNSQVIKNVPPKHIHKFHVVGDLMLEAANKDYATSQSPSLEVGRHLVGLLPGSKPAKLTQGVPLELAIAEYIYAKRPHTKFFIPVAPTLDLLTLASFANPQKNKFAQSFGFQGAYLKDNYLETSGGLMVELTQENPAYHLLSSCAICLTTVGANTAELGALGVPMIVLLPTQQLDAMRSWDGLPGLLANLPFVGSSLAKLINWWFLRNKGLLAWPNIWAGREIVPELVGNLAPHAVGEMVLDLLENPLKLAQMKHQLLTTRGESGAAKRLAQLVGTLLSA